MYLSQKIKKSYSIQVSYTEAFTSQTFIPIPLLLDILKTVVLFYGKFFDQKSCFSFMVSSRAELYVQSLDDAKSSAAVRVPVRRLNNVCSICKVVVFWYFFVLFKFLVFKLKIN